MDDLFVRLRDIRILLERLGMPERAATIEEAAARLVYPDYRPVAWGEEVDDGNNL